MAANIPAKLKAADLTRFCVRAAQLESVKPVVAYWCEFWIANQIIAKGLHNGDDETLQYTTGLMDKLEQIKADNSTNDAIMDDMAGQAYVEQFASETFDRADRAVHANKVTKQTADTFQAASTFFELVNIWGPPDAETQAKIKYAKWNAVRIVKALKEGKDPNESNPKPQPKEDPSPMISNNGEDEVDAASRSHHATVEEVPDDQDQFNRDVVLPGPPDDSLRHVPSPVLSKPEVSPRDDFTHTEGQDDNNVSPLESSQSNDRSGSIGGGFFPLPTFTAESNDSTLPTAPPSDVNNLGLPNQPSFTPGSEKPLAFEPPPTHPSGPQDYYRATPPQVQPSPMNLPYIPPQQPNPQISQNTQEYAASQARQQAPRPVQYQPPVQHTIPSSAAAGAGPVEVDDEAISQAQKHARWAISALNFEDTKTAVRELREALKSLGAAS